MTVRMFVPINGKRPSLEEFDQGIRLKKLCTIENGKEPDTRLPDTHGYGPFEQNEVNLLSQSSSSTPQHPRNAPEYRVPHDFELPPEEKPLTSLNSFDDSDGLTLRTNPRSGNGIESLNEEISLDDDEKVSRVCFGVLIVTVTSASERTELDRVIPVDLEKFGEMVKLKIQSTGKYAGLIRLPTICELLSDIAVGVSATLVDNTSNSTASSTKKSVNIWHSSIVRIVLTGLQPDRVRIGKLLSDSHLFLQHPYVGECGQLEYCNPHYLVRPGRLMPKLEDTVGFAASHKSLGALTEVSKSRILRIFDCAGIGNEGCRQKGLLSHRVKSVLKGHQLTAVAMMLERESSDVDSCDFPSIWEVTKSTDPAKRYRNKVTGIYTRSPTLVRGGLLAEDMGLGKTLSALTLICLSLDSDGGDEDTSRPTLVVTTKSTLPGWQSQIERHVHYGQLQTALYHGQYRHLLAPRFDELDVILTTYETLRSECGIGGPLFQTQWRRLVLDEAHHIRNRASQIFIAACSVKAYYRWCLTGTPVQNSLDDYGALLTFLDVPVFTKKTMFDFWITKPIHENKPEGLARLQALVRGTCIRRTKESLGDVLRLPHRQEKIEYVFLHQQDQDLYDFFKARSASLASKGNTTHSAIRQLDDAGEGGIIRLLNFLRLICNHGEQLLPDTALRIWNSRDQRMSAANEITTSDQSSDSPAYSAKILALLGNLIATHTPTYDSKRKEIPVKSVVFSYSTKMLDRIQQALSHYSFTTCRIDGSKSLEERSTALKSFNEDFDCTVMLATIGSAGEGLDLTVASRVHIVEPQWNPMAEAQAVDRIYRIGQQQDVFVTRYIVPNSIETYIQWVQQQKSKLVSKFADTDGVTQAEQDTERWKQLRNTLMCE